MPKRKPQKTKYFNWGTEKFGRPVYWHKGNWQNHVDRHEKLLSSEQTFIDTLEDPDCVFPDLNEDGVSCYYKVDAFKVGDHSVHAQVVVIEDGNTSPPPTRGKYMIVKTAMDRADIPEDGVREAKFDKRKK